MVQSIAQSPKSNEGLSRDPPSTKSKFSTAVFNLAKSIIGAGVLSLPHGVSLYSNDPHVLLPAVIFCVIFCFAATYTFVSIGSLCRETKSANIREIWSRSIDHDTSWLISLSITLMCLFSSVAYSIIIGDTFTSLLESCFSIPQFDANRSVVIFVTSTVLLLPLCLVRSLQSLSSYSVIGIVGSIYIALFMTVRASDHSYDKGGAFFGDLHLAPSFSGSYSWFSSSSFSLLSMFSTSFIAHYNAPRFFHELENPTPQRFSLVATIAFVSSMIIFIIIMVTGFLTFGASADAFILNNYSSHDMYAGFARGATGLAVITGYPFTFTGFRDGLWDLQGTSDAARSTSFSLRTIALLTVISCCAIMVKDVSVVVGLSGSLFGSWLLLIVPSLFNLSSFHRRLAQAVDEHKFDDLEDSRSLMAKKRKPIESWPIMTLPVSTWIEIAFNILMIVSGAALMIVGLSVNVHRIVYGH